jgi:hypothetical protein
MYLLEPCFKCLLTQLLCKRFYLCLLTATQLIHVLKSCLFLNDWFTSNSLIKFIYHLFCKYVTLTHYYIDVHLSGRIYLELEESLLFALFYEL